MKMSNGHYNRKLRHKRLLKLAIRAILSPPIYHTAPDHYKFSQKLYAIS